MDVLYWSLSGNFVATAETDIEVLYKSITFNMYYHILAQCNETQSLWAKLQVQKLHCTEGQHQNNNLKKKIGTKLQGNIVPDHEERFEYRAFIMIVLFSVKLD